ncbi:MAG: hypothetical protein A2138_07775 [Deltaproteobacteria bacterium RBG_16_71_12]|nr:MAG: hypothetical protein A2138_07775 [Deltaproteobacteria bacterium RBG_16_71_12]
MILVMKEETIGAAQFKATCLAVLDDVARSGRPVIVTKRGKPVAKLVPLTKKRRRPFSKSVLYIADDIVKSTGDKWNAGG